MIDEELGTETPEQADELTPFGCRLKTALETIIAQLCRDELLEVGADRTEDLIMELTRAGLDANSPKQLVKKVRRTLLDSTYVEEIYASDDALDDTIRSALDDT